MSIPGVIRYLMLCLPLVSALSAATGDLRGIVHDPQHRPLPAAQVVANSTGGAATRSVQSDANGEFQIDNLPEGAYSIAISAPGFQMLEQQVTVAAGKSPVLHFQLELAAVNSSVQVSDATSRLNPQTSTVRTLVSPQEIQQTAGADQANSLAMITNFTPGAYMVHDMLHMRGGHQVNWFFDGIPVVNTNIAANVAPLINPKNVEELEIERGGYSSEYGDRTYGFFNVVTPSGFERNNEAELILSAGNFYSTDDQFNIGSHTQRFAYYASVDGSRSELGLDPPVSQVIHDQTSGVGGFAFSALQSQRKRSAPLDRLATRRSLSDPQRPRTIRPPASAISISKRTIWWASTGCTGSPTAFRSRSRPTTTTTRRSTSAGRRTRPFILDDNNRSNYVGVRSVVQLSEEAKQRCQPASRYGASTTTPFSDSQTIPAATR